MRIGPLEVIFAPSELAMRSVTPWMPFERLTFDFRGHRRLAYSPLIREWEEDPIACHLPPAATISVTTLACSDGTRVNRVTRVCQRENDHSVSVTLIKIKIKIKIILFTSK